MTVAKLKAKQLSAKALIAGERDVMKALVKEALDEVLDAEMTQFLGAGYAGFPRECAGAGRDIRPVEPVPRIGSFLTCAHIIVTATTGPWSARNRPR